MRILWGACMATLLAGAMAYAQDYQYQAAPSQDVTVAPADNAVVSGDINAAGEGTGTTVQGSAVTVNEDVVAEGQGVSAVNYDIAALPAEDEGRGGSLLPREDQMGISGTLSSWDTSPTGVYQSSRDHLGSPFPMAAAPSIDTGDRTLVTNENDLPPSMAGNVSGWTTSPTAVHEEYQLNVGSPFPMSADPSIRMGKNPLEHVDEGADFSKGTGQPFADTASPFPTAGAPARRNWW